MTPLARQIVVGTAGHIDHGKSRLVRALTGTDPDRLKEEKERGITIDLGFATLDLDDGTRVGFVDVPGHERFVKNMLAGVGGIDVVLMVIAADESIKPQTREHFEICRLLRIPAGVIVLTKCDLVDADLLELVRREVQEFVAGSFLENAPILPVSSRTGEGLADLREALGRAAAAVPPRPQDGLPRLPVDRSFIIKGFGSVVTGTMIAGTLRREDEVVLLPRGTRARIRGLEVFHRDVDVAAAGQRTAVNLHGVEAAGAVRGDVLSLPDVLEPSHLLDAVIEVVKGAPAPLKDRDRVRLHHGTSEVLARVRLMDVPELRPGGTAFGQLRLERPLVALAGDRFILRRYSPAVTIGGGRVLHNRPGRLGRVNTAVRRRFERLADDSPEVRLQALVEESGPRGLDAPGVRARTGLAAAAVSSLLERPVGRGEVVALPSLPVRYLDAGIHRALSERLLDLLRGFHEREPLAAGPSREEVRTRLFGSGHPDVFRCLVAGLAQSKLIRIEKDRLALGGHRIDLDPREAGIMETLESRFATAGTNPPNVEAVLPDLGIATERARKLFHLLLNRGLLVRIPDGKVFHARVIEDLKTRLWERRTKNPTLDISAFKDLSGTSRRNAIPLLEHLDQQRVTRREGDHRVILPPPPAN